MVVRWRAKGRPSPSPRPRLSTFPAWMSLTHSQPGLAVEPIRGSSEVTAITQGKHIRPVQLDPCAHLVGDGHGPVTRDDDIDLVRHVLEQPQPDEVLLDRVVGAVQVVEHRDEDVGEHVAGDEDAALLDQQRRMARGVRRMLDDADSRAVPREQLGSGGQAGDEAEQVQRYARRRSPAAAPRGRGSSSRRPTADPA